jgi:hypothetical protein
VWTYNSEHEWYKRCVCRVRTDFRPKEVK